MCSTQVPTNTNTNTSTQTHNTFHESRHVENLAAALIHPNLLAVLSVGIDVLDLPTSIRGQIPSFPDSDLRGFSDGFACESVCAVCAVCACVCSSWCMHCG